MPGGELNDCTTYAVRRHQPQLTPEDVTYVNMKPSPQGFLRVQEPPGNSVSSGPVEHAAVTFRATTPHSGTENRSLSAKQPKALGLFTEFCWPSLRNDQFVSSCWGWMCPWCEAEHSWKDEAHGCTNLPWQKYLHFLTVQHPSSALGKQI